MNTECAREQDILDAVAAGRWPDRCDSELRHHVEGCAICQDTACVFVAIADDRDSAWEETTVPPASLVWWRAQMRAREEATRVAGRPIAIVQAVAVACLMAAALALIPLAWPVINLAVSSAAGVAAWLTPRAQAVSTAFTLVTGSALPLIPLVAAWILLAPIVLYLALTGD